MPELQLALLIGGIWAAGKGMLDASSFVNDLRDSVVIGAKGGQSLSLNHRRVLRFDWLLTMVGTVVFPIIYSVLLYVLVSGTKLDAHLQIVIRVVSLVPLTGSFLFVVCGILDWRLMTAALHDAAKASAIVAPVASMPTGNVAMVGSQQLPRPREES